MPGRAGLIAIGVILLIGLLVAGKAGLLHSDPARTALAAHLRMPEGPDAGYPRLGPTLRSRAWMKQAPGQPDGIAEFIRLPDVVFAAERVIADRDLRPSFALIAGKTWDGARGSWSDSAGNVMPLSQVTASLEAACPTPADAHLILDLLTGQPSPEAAQATARMLIGDLPQAVRIRPFHGKRGTLLRNRGSPPYQETERGYAGCLLHFEGRDYPAEWRVGRLVAVGF